MNATKYASVVRHWHEEQPSACINISGFTVHFQWEYERDRDCYHWQWLTDDDHDSDTVLLVMERFINEGWGDDLNDTSPEYIDRLLAWLKTV